MNKQKGFTVVELLIAIAITGLIVSFLGTAIHQIITVTEYGNDKLTAMHELQNAAHWVSLDGQMASTANTSDGLLLTLSDNSSISYTLAGTVLRRSAQGSQMTLARNISNLTFTIENRIITVNLTSSPAGRQNVSEQGIYKIFLRPGEE